MLSDRTVYLNGKFVEWDKATVHIMSHSFSRGSAIFEVLSFHQTETGPAVFRLDEHIHRLFRSAELLSMELPVAQEALQKAVLATVKTNNLSGGLIKLVCYYHDIAFEILPPRSRLDVCIAALDPSLDFGGLWVAPSKGASACICKWRKLDPQTVPVEAKVAANYLNGMMARLESKRRGFDMAVMTDTQGFVAEGGTESVFCVKDGVLTTPTLGTVLQSISRKSVLEVARASKIETAEKRFDPECLLEADEIFFSCAPQKIWPVRKIENRVIRPVPGPVTQRLTTLLDEICSGRNRHFKNWLFPVR